MKIPIIRKGEYDIWSMRMRQYICHTDHNLWDVIINGDLEEEPAPTGETSAPPAPKTAKHNWLLKRIRKELNIDEIDIDDLYNNLRVYEDEMKRSSSFTPTSQNLAFLSSKNTSSTNEVSTASGDFGVSTAGGTSQVSSTLCAHDIDGDDLEELDLQWQVAMLTVRVKKSGRNQGRRSYGDNGRSNAPTNESSSQALVAQDGLGGYDWSNDFEIEPVNYALMAISSLSSSSSFDNEVQKYSKQCLESFKTLQKNYDSKREKHSKARLEFHGSSDEESTPVNDMLSKADGYHVVPPPITGNFLTSRADISFAGLDEYVIKKKTIESKTTDLNTKTSETVGKTNEVNTQKPKTVYESVNIDKIIIEDWNSNDEDDVSEVQTVSHVKTNESQTVKPRVDKIEIVLQDHAVVDSGCSSHMTGNKAYLSDNEDFNGGFMAFRSDPTRTHTLFSSPKVLVGIMEVSAQAKEIKALNAQGRKSVKSSKGEPSMHKDPAFDDLDDDAMDYMETEDAQDEGRTSSVVLEEKESADKEVSTEDKIGKEDFSEEKGVQKEYVSKQGRKSVKSSKGEPSVHNDLAFDDLDDDAMDYMETEDAQDEGRTSSVMLEEKESAYKEVSTEAPVSIVKPNEGTDKRNKGTDKQDGGTDSTKVSTDRQGEGTADQNKGKSATQIAPTTTSTPTPTIFGDDETIAQVLIIMSQNKQKEKEKGLEIRNVEDTERQRPTSTRSVLTLKPLPKIDPKDKGKKMIDEEGESDTESYDITEA
ncbi:hypothetical protein Tco_1153839 [Tanacetum coccineum]